MPDAHNRYSLERRANGSLVVEEGRIAHGAALRPCSSAKNLAAPRSASSGLSPSDGSVMAHDVLLRSEPERQDASSAGAPIAVIMMIATLICIMGEVFGS
jgi:hypothetical protein